jgi:hypothetical protein
MTNRETAELIAKFRTPPGFSWQDLADDIETALDTKAAELTGSPSDKSRFITLAEHS